MEIMTIEEHQKCGGFGNAILEGFNELEESNKISKISTI